MSAHDLACDVDEAGVATIAWDLADRPVNVLAPGNIAAFDAAVERALGDDAVCGVIVASRKRDFLAGLDLAAVVSERLAGIADAVDAFRAVTRRMETGGKPFVAVLAGSALGGGAELALGTHRRIAANDAPHARFGFPEVTLGLVPGGGGTQRVPRLCGIAAALPLLLEGERLSFADAHALGLIDELAPAAELHARARAWILANRDARAPWDVAGFRFPGGTPQTPAIAELFLGANAMLAPRAIRARRSRTSPSSVRG